MHGSAIEESDLYLLPVYGLPVAATWAAAYVIVLFTRPTSLLSLKYPSPTDKALQIYNNISMLFLFPVTRDLLFSCCLIFTVVSCIK